MVCLMNPVVTGFGKLSKSHDPCRWLMMVLIQATLLRCAADDALDHWHLRDSTAPNTVRYLNGIFVAVGSNIVASANGTVWVPHSIGSAETLKGVTYVPGSPGYFVAVGSSVFKSTDGATWTRRPLAPPDTFTDIAYSSAAGGFVATALNYQAANVRVYFSTNLNNWLPIALPSSAFHSDKTTKQVIMAGNQFFVVGGGSFDDHIWRSSDGTNWQYLIYANQYPGGFVYANGQLAFIGNEGCPLVSVDLGNNWSTFKDTNFCSGSCLFCNYGHGVTYGNHTWATVYYNLGAGVLSSTNLQSWQKRTALRGKQLYSIAFGSGTFVAVGPDGIYQSDSVVTPRISLLRKGDGTGVFVQVSGEVGRQYRLQFSEDMTSWHDERVFTADLPTMQFDEPFDPQLSNKFLRAVSP